MIAFLLDAATGEHLSITCGDKADTPVLEAIMLRSGWSLPPSTGLCFACVGMADEVARLVDELTKAGAMAIYASCGT